MTRARDTFTKTLKETKRLINNNPGAREAKIEIRRRVLEAIGADKAHVFDGFCGAGEMYEAVWKSAASYIGCDQTWYRDERTVFVADTYRVMRAIDLAPFTVLDFDAYGSPWHAIIILCARRGRLQPGERLGLVMTEGAGLRMKMGWIPDALALMSRLNRHMPGVARAHGDIIDRALAETCRRLNCKIAHRWQAKGKAASQLFYIGLVLEGL